MTERNDELPASPDDPRDEEREDRLDAMLSLSSPPPRSLDERIAARRAAGDRMLLPVPGEPAASKGDRGGMRRFLLPIGLVAAAAAALVIREYVGRTPERGTAAPPLAQRDSVPPSASDTSTSDSIESRDTTVPRSGPGSLTPRRGANLGFDRSRGTTLFSVEMRAFSEPAIDSIVAEANAQAATSVSIAYPATSSQLTSLARRIEQELVARGIPRPRVDMRPATSGSVMTTVVTVAVERPR